MEEGKSKTEEVKEEVKKERIEIIIPQCCREGWDSCKHVAKKVKLKKQNVGL